MKLTELMAAVRHLGRVRDYLPICCTCNKPVERIADEPMPMPNRTVRVVFMCHGEHEVCSLRLDDESPIKAWPKRVFLRNWAGYTIRTERATGRRMP